MGTFMVWGFEFFSAISAYLCDLCVNCSREKYLRQRSQRYAEIAEQKTLHRSRGVQHACDGIDGPADILT